MAKPTTKNKEAFLLERNLARNTEIPARAVEPFENIMAFAIREKEKSYDFYTKLAQKVKHPWTRKAFVSLAADELRQKNRLLAMKREGFLPRMTEKTGGLNISDYVTAEVVLREEMDTREALMIAIKAAEAAQTLYLDLADKSTDAAAQAVFRSLALEQAKQKLTLETEYDDRVFAQN
jgi:rubrerythrin